jgi:hypothetical protein
MLCDTVERLADATVDVTEATEVAEIATSSLIAFITTEAIELSSTDLPRKKRIVCRLFEMVQLDYPALRRPFMY